MGRVSNLFGRGKGSGRRRKGGAAAGPPVARAKSAPPKAPIPPKAAEGVAPWELVGPEELERARLKVRSMDTEILSNLQARFAAKYGEPLPLPEAVRVDPVQDLLGDEEEVSAEGPVGRGPEPGAAEGEGAEAPGAALPPPQPPSAEAPAKAETPPGPAAELRAEEGIGPEAAETAPSDEAVIDAKREGGADGAPPERVSWKDYFDLRHHPLFFRDRFAPPGRSSALRTVLTAVDAAFLFLFFLPVFFVFGGLPGILLWCILGFTWHRAVVTVVRLILRRARGG